MTEPAVFTLDFRRLARLAWQRRKALAIVNGAVAVIMLGVAFGLPRWYRSSITMVPAPMDGLGLDMTGVAGALAASPLTFGAGPTPQNQLKMVVSSRAVADSIVRKFDLLRVERVRRLDQARDRLIEHTRITTPKQGEVVVEVEARSPVLARDLATAYSTYAASEGARLKRSLASQRRLYLEARLADLERELTGVGQRVRQFEEKHRALALPEQTRETVDAAGNLQAQTALLETELASAKRYFTESSPEILVLRDRVTELKRQLRSLVTTGGAMLPRGEELPALKQEYLDLSREQQSLFAVSELLQRAYEQARVEEADPVPAFSVLDAADLPERHARPRRGLLVALATLVSMLITLGDVYVAGPLVATIAGRSRRRQPAVVEATPEDQEAAA